VTHTDTSNAGIDPGTELEVSDEKRERGLKYVSKSRIQSWFQCPFKFAQKYWMEHRPPGTMATTRGGDVHEIFEIFHENLIEHLESNGDKPGRFTPLMPNTGNATQWMEEYLGNFWCFEERRWQEAQRSVDFAQSRLPAGVIEVEQATLNAWEPLEVEAEFWLGEVPDDYDRADPDYVNPDGPPVGDIPWMGKADVILNSASVPGVTGTGVTIVDYKTGGCPKVKYEGAPFLDEVMDKTFRETEYYSWLAEDVYDVDAVAIYYPRDDELVVGESGVQERRFDIKKAALAMQELPEELNEDGEPANFERDEGNLCHWGSGMCHFYNICQSDVGKQ
jgi:hypothetical protein